MYVIMENGYEMERFMDGTLWYCRILQIRSWILDWLVSCHDHCDLDEFYVLDNDTKKKAVKKSTENLLQFLCVFKMQFCNVF